MHELRLVAVSEDGSYAVLVVPGRGGRFSLQIDDRLRAVARGQFSRLAQYEIEVESPLRPKEIQERIRAGETADEIADAAGVPIERVRWFEGPVLAERAYRAQEAQTAMVRRPGDSGPGPRLGEVVTERLNALGVNAEDAQWDSTKRADGSWQVQLGFATGGRPHTAQWVYDPRRKHAVPADEGAAALSLPEADLLAQAGGSQGQATVTPLQPRLSQHAAPSPRPALRADPVRPPEPAAPPREARAREARAQEARAQEARAQDDRVQDDRVQERDRAQERRAQQGARAQEARAQERRAQEGGRTQEARTQESRPQESRRERRLERAHQRAPEPAAAGPGPAVTAPEPEAEIVPEAPAAEAGREAERAPAARRAAGGRGRRSSVPSWDEIMFGSSRPRD